MFCEKCGNQLSDDAMFCPKCGNSIVAATDQPVQEPIQQPVYEQPIQQPVYQQPVQQPIYGQPPMPEGAPKKSKKGLIIGIVSGVVVLAAVVVLLLGFLVFDWFGGEKKSSDKDDKKEKATVESVVDDEEEETEDDLVSSNGSGYSLKEVGTISDPDKTLCLSDEYGIYKTENGSRKLFNYLGEEKFGTLYSNTEKLTEGIYAVNSVVKNKTDSMNYCGIVNIQGEELLPCEAAIIESLSDRYALVYYTTEVTENEDECFIFTSSNGFYEVSPSEGSIMYKGYAQIYDLQNRKFVPNLKFTNSPLYAVQVCGNSFVVDGVYLDQKDNKDYVYNSDGQLLYQAEGTIEVGDGFFVSSNNGKYSVYDENANEMFISDKSISIPSGNGQYVYASDSESKTVTVYDLSGNQVYTGQYDYIASINDDVMSVKKGDFYGLMKVDGTEILPCDSEDSCSYLSDGYWYRMRKVEDDYVYDIVGLDGILAEGAEYSNELVFTYSGKETDEVILLKGDGSTLEVVNYDYEEIAKGLIANKVNDKYGLVEVYNGSNLLEYEYDDIDYAGGYIYAYKDDSWIVYELEGNIF